MKTSRPLVLMASVCGCLLAIGCASTPEGQATQKKKYPTAESIFKEGDVKNHPPTIYQHPIEEVRPAAARAQHTLLKRADPAKPEEHPIDVYIQHQPTKPFEGVAVHDAHCQPQYWDKPSLEKHAMTELKRQAREAGCDAIIEVAEIKPAAKNWTLETRTMHVTAPAIIYK